MIESEDKAVEKGREAGSKSEKKRLIGGRGVQEYMNLNAPLSSTNLHYPELFHI